MRIIADRKDYYDCVQAHGQDQTLLYVRNPEEEEIESKKYPFPRLYGRSVVGGVDTSAYIIGFCGKIYPVIKLRSTQCFNLEEVEAFVVANLKPRELKIFRGEARRLFRGWSWYCSKRECAKFFEDCKQDQDKHKQMFEDRRCPIFVARHDEWRKARITYNAMLRPYDFVRVFDPYTAFQEISMFLGNMAMPEKEMPIVPDELKIYSRGFTDQSFRAPFRDDKRIPK